MYQYINDLIMSSFDTQQEHLAHNVVPNITNGVTIQTELTENSPSPSPPWEIYSLPLVAHLFTFLQYSLVNVFKYKGIRDTVIFMNWQSFVDEIILGTSQVAKAAIHGLNGTRYAASSGFTIPNTTICDIVAAITTDPSQIYAKGITLGHVKYIFLKVDPGRAIVFRSGSEGGIAIKTNKCVIIGTYNEGMDSGDCCSVIEKFADQFIIVDF